MKSPKNDQIIAAVLAADGNISAAAHALGCNRKTIHRRAVVVPAIADAIETARETLLDEAEAVLARKVREGYTPELLFFLKTQGRPRGYIERHEHVVYTPQQLEAMTDAELQAISDGSE